MNTWRILHDWSAQLWAVGAPAQGGLPPVGPWGHFFWVCVILALIIFVCWWAWSMVGPRIPQPLNTILFVLGVIAIALITIFWVLVPLSTVF